MNKYIFLFLFTVALNLNSFSQELPFAFTHGPYLQGLGETEVTLVWTTNRKGISWVELAPNDSTHFYLTKRPGYYSESYGFKVVDSVHTVKITGLRPDTK